MTIKLARITERDGLVFLVDKDGKELLFQVVPKETTHEMHEAGYEQMELGHHSTCVYNAMLSAAKVDVSAALVKVPERRKPTMKNWGDVEMRGWNACLDELEGK